MGRVSLEELSSVIAVIHAAAASPDRWSEALSAGARGRRAPVGLPDEA